MIHFDHISYQYPQQSVPVLREFDWQIRAGEMSLLSGSSGSGKSTIIRVATGLIPEYYGGRFSGAVRFSEEYSGGPIALCGQDPESQTILDHVEDEIAFGLEQIGLSRSEMHRRVHAALETLNIEHLRTRDIATLSGGERQRVAIASALAVSSQVLILDEPLSQLDPWAATKIASVLHSLTINTGCTVLISEHRTHYLHQFASEHMYLGGDEQPLPKPGNTPDKIATSPIRGVREVSAEVDAISYVIDGTPVLDNVSATFQSGTISALIGKNGAGKTTLLRMLNGLLRPDRGRVLHNQRDISSLKAVQLAQHTGYVPQNPNSLLFSERVIDEVTMGFRDEDKAASARQLLSRYELEHYETRHPFDLSVGERQRLAFSAIFARQPSILLLDEPTRGLDSRNRERLIHDLLRRRSVGATIVIATHDLSMVSEIADQTIALDRGAIVQPDDMLKSASRMMTPR